MRRLPSLIALRFFEKTACHLSFNRAATALCVTQGAVSRQIKILENSLKFHLSPRNLKHRPRQPQPHLAARQAQHPHSPSETQPPPTSTSAPAPPAN